MYSNRIALVNITQLLSTGLCTQTQVGQIIWRLVRLPCRPFRSRKSRVWFMSLVVENRIV